MRCPECNSSRLHVVSTTSCADGRVVRRRNCLICSHRFYTIQQVELLLPKDAFRWVERKGQRHTVELLAADGH